MRVLVVDDDAISRQIVQAALNHFGYTCLLAKDAHEGLELLEQNHIDAVISDWMMPDVDGPEFCQQIRKRKYDHYIYFIFMTVLTDKAHLLTGIKAGADDYLTKPVDVIELRLRLLAALRIANYNQNLKYLTEQVEILQQESGKEKWSYDGYAWHFWHMDNSRGGRWWGKVQQQGGKWRTQIWLYIPASENIVSGGNDEEFATLDLGQAHCQTTIARLVKA